MEDPFVLQVVHLQDYYTKKIKELDEKIKYYCDDVIAKKQNEMALFLDEIEKDLPPMPTDGISFKHIRNQREQQPTSEYGRKSGTLTPKRLNSEIIQDVTQSTIFKNEPSTLAPQEKNVRYSDIITGQPKGVRSTSQQPQSFHDPFLKVTQSTIERTTIFVAKEKK